MRLHLWKSYIFKKYFSLPTLNSNTHTDSEWELSGGGMGICMIKKIIVLLDLKGFRYFILIALL